MTGPGSDPELVRGSGNVFADLGLPNPELEQLRAVLAAEVGKALSADGWNPRGAAIITGIPASAFARIRKARLKGLTIKHLMTMLDRLGRRARVSVAVVPRG